MKPKAVFKSRTVLFNLLAGLSLMIPSDAWRAFLSDNPEFLPAVLTIGNIILRAVTKNGVVLIPDEAFGDQPHR